MFPLNLLDQQYFQMNYSVSPLVIVPYGNQSYPISCHVYPSYPFGMDIRQQYLHPETITNYSIPASFPTMIPQPFRNISELRYQDHQWTKIVSDLDKQGNNPIQDVRKLKKKNQQCSIDKSQDNFQQKSKKKYTQNPRRNVITNLGNQLLASLSNRFKLNELLRKFPQKPDEELLCHMIMYVNQVKKSLNSYLNTRKMEDIWYPSDINHHLIDTVQLFRKVSYHYLTSHVHLQVIKSQKMKEETKVHHLKGIKSLISVLRNPPKKTIKTKNEP